MWALIYLLVFIVFTIIAYALMPKPQNPQAAQANKDMQISTAEPGRPIPVVFGTYHIKGTNIVWYGDLKTEEIKKVTEQKGGRKWLLFGPKKTIRQEQTVGYKYFMGMHIIVSCIVDQLKEIYVGEKPLNTGDINDTVERNISLPDLFGGDEKEGGLSGPLEIWFGKDNQPPSEYLKSKVGSPCPAFRGVLGIILKSFYVAANSPYPKPWTFLVKRIPKWYPEKADIDGSANIAHIIYETLTDPDWGMGYPTNMLDENSFRDCANTLYAEKLGASILLASQSTIEDFIYEMLGHCNGMLYTRQDNGQFALKLLRENYDKNNLPHYNEHNVIQLESFERPAYGEIVNEVVVTYHPRGKTSDDTVTVQDLAGIQAQQGVISHSATYAGIDTMENALRLAARDLRQKSTPLCRIKLTVNRAAWNLQIGQVFNFSWTAHNIGKIPFRVMQINYGTLENGAITIDAIEDIFGLPDTTYVKPQKPQWTDPVIPPKPLRQSLVTEFTLWELAQHLEDASEIAKIKYDFSTIRAYAGAEDYLLQNCEMYTWGRNDGWQVAAGGGFTPWALTSSAIDRQQISIPYSNPQGAVRAVKSGSFAYLGKEIVRIDSVTASEITVGRGCLDTVPTTHAEGELIMFCEGHAIDDFRSYFGWEHTYVRLCPRNTQAVLNFNNAPEIQTDVNARQYKPLPPAYLQFNGEWFPEQIQDKLVITWSNRNRLSDSGFKTLYDWKNAPNEIEPETKIAIKVYYGQDGSKGKVVDIQVDSATRTWTLPDFANVQKEAEKHGGFLWISVGSIRAGMPSYTSYQHTVKIKPKRNGFGVNFGATFGD